MAPGYKRKRGDGRHNSHDDDNTSNRPSPHRPGPMRDNLANSSMNSPRGGRRGSGSRQHNARGAPNGPQGPNVAQPSPTAMSPHANAYQPSRPTAPSAPSTLAPPRAQAPRKPKLDEAALEDLELNDYLTKERVTNWNAEARDAVVQAATTAQQDNDGVTLALIYLELIEASTKQYMDQVEIGTMVRDIVQAPSHELCDTTTLFLDSISTLTVEFTGWEHLKEMLIQTDIPLEKMRIILDVEQLVGLGLVRSSFEKMAVRKATDAVYRQANYNLLREESEGFSKLITEYFTTVNSEPPSAEVCRQTYQRVNAFIGSFDLDVGRTLDVTLDVFANLLVKHNRFFIKYLRGSAWWPVLQGAEVVNWKEPAVQALPRWALPESPSWTYTDAEKGDQLRQREDRDKVFWKEVALLDKKRQGLRAFFKLGSREIVEAPEVPQKPDEDPRKAAEKTEAQLWTEEWIKETGTLPPTGNDIAAQLLGFKLQFYARDDRDAGDVLPDNLIYLAALLIKVGFISIMDLWPHLYPTDDAMPTFKVKLEQEKRDRDAKEKKGSSKENALAMAGALPDDTPQSNVSRLREAASKTESERTTPAKAEDDASNKLPEPADQKVALLRSLLCIGAIPEALFIIGQYPWFLDVYPDLHPYIFRIAHHSLSKVYESSRPVPLEKIPTVAKGAASNALPRLCDYTPRRTLRWAKPDQKDAGDGVDYRFYWEDWIDNVPICQTVDDVFLLCQSWLGLVGPECGKDIMLMTKLARIGKRSLTDDTSDMNRNRWMGLSSSLIAPSLTFTGQNPGVVNETWELLKHFDTAERYTIYKNWFRSTKPLMRAVFKDVEDGTKRLLSRVAATNTRPMGRAMAKLACPCPGTVFDITLKQGQSYINMIDALVECSRYLTHLGYDCLTATLVDSLLNKDRDTLQGDGMLVKPWLKHTAIFIGKVYKRYSYMNPTPVLQLVKEQVFRPQGELFMLEVLEQLLSTMGGIGLSGALTEARVLALSAGPGLRAYTLENHLGDKRHEGKFASRRLIRCLDQPQDPEGSALGPEILVALAMQVDSYLYREELREVPDKVVFTLYDKLRSHFAQFVDFIRENTLAQDFDKITPGVVELMSEYDLPPKLAFQISRASVAVRVNAARLGNKTATNGTNIDGDVIMDEPEALPHANGVTAPFTNSASNESSSALDADMKDATPASTSLVRRPNSAIETIVSQLKSTLPDDNDYKNHACLRFLVTFWTLDIKDVLSTEQGELKKQYEDAKTHIKRKGPQSFSQRHVKEECEKLTEEYEMFMKTAQLTQIGLAEEMHQWFGAVANSTDLHDMLLQDCFVPRIQTSLQDAQFSSTMLFFMHRTGVPAFRLPKFLDQLFIANKITKMILMMSEDEAKYFGRFLNDVLRELQRWHEDKEVFEKNALGESRQLSGFAKSFNPDGTLKAFIVYEEFRNLLFKWHSALSTALKTCLNGGQYTELRNSVNILKAVSPAFPKVDHMANDLRQIVEGYAKEDDRDDVKVAANSLLFEFKRSAKLQKTETFFRTGVHPVVSGIAAPSRMTSEQPKTPQPPDTAAKKLNATVPPFKPNTPEINGQSKPAPATDAPDDRKPPPASNPSSVAPSVNSKDISKPSPAPSEPNNGRVPPNKPAARTTAPHPSPAPVNSVPSKPDSRNMTQGPNHPLPIRPDAQPPRSRQPERLNDRTADYRPNAPGDYGRLDRGRDAMQDREATPGRRRSRSPIRGPPMTDRRSEWAGREARDYDDHGALRPPPRDARGPPTRGTPYGDSPRDPRDARDVRDIREYRERELLRERPDSRAPLHASLPTPADGRGRMHSSSMLANDTHPHRRDTASNALHGERGGALPPRLPINVPPAANDRPLINPERAALINDDRGRLEPLRHDRDARNDSRNDGRRDEPSSRRDRGSRPQSRPQSPRRDERPSAAPYHSSDTRRDYRDERPPPHTAGRERQEPMSIAPTGPRSGRDVPATPQVSREIFQPPRGRTAAQDPNYGRLNQPVETIPSGPRHPISDRRDVQNQIPVVTTPTAPAAQQSGVHPSRMGRINGPPLQTNVPSGPRGPGRTPKQPVQSPSARNPPTGPAGERERLRTPSQIANTILSASTQSNAPLPPTLAERPPERSSRNNAPPVLPPASVDHPTERSSRRSEQSSRRERSRSPDRKGGDDRPRSDKRERSRREPLEPREERTSRDSRDGRERSDRDRGDRERRGDDRDRRSRGGVGGDDTRGDRSDGKRRRDAGDQPHGETKRSRR